MLLRLANLRPTFVPMLGLFLLSWSAIADPGDGQAWEKAGSGEHSIRSLGSDFWVEVPARRAEGSRVILFNHALAKRIGLDISGSQEDLERRILEHFAWVVAKPGESFDKKFVATRYQDSGSKKAGEALGDGRAFWLGELQIPMKDGTILYVDFSSKGVGQTPLAWLNHSDPLHKDGLQSMEEAVHSFAMSEINLRNGLDTVGDLAVIELPFVKMDKNTKQTAKAAITVRVGNQTRIAHYRYFADNKAQFRKIFEYCVKRDLGLPLEAKVGPEHVEKYLDLFSTNIGEEAARYYDLHAVHASPTAGNRTTRGATIDLGTFRYLDAHHGEYTYLFDKLKLQGQTHQLRGYVQNIHSYAAQAGYMLPAKQTAASSLAKFDFAFEKELTKLSLRRVGLDDESIAKLSPALKRNFLAAVKNMYETLGTEAVKLGGDRFVKAAAYEPREILRKAIFFHANRKNAKSSFFGWVTYDQEWSELFKSSRPWAKPNASLMKKHANEFGATIQAIFDTIRPNFEQLAEWKARAETLGAQARPSVGRKFYEDFEKPALEAIRGGKALSEANESILKGVDTLVDLGVHPRPTAHLGRAPRIAVFSGTFDPPHRGHEEFVARMMEAYRIDRVYIVTNPVSDHKSGVTSYELRREMTAATFAGNKHIAIADAEMEKAFLRDDMNGVLALVHEKHPTSDLVQIMGDDSFERFQRIGVMNPHVTAIVVNPRSADVVLPPALKNVPVLNARRMGAFTTSSTLVRSHIANGSMEAIKGVIKPTVAKIIQREKLYVEPKKGICQRWLGVEPGFGF